MPKLKAGFIAAGIVGGVGLAVGMRRWRSSNRLTIRRSPQLTDAVSISRNELGIPHVKAANQQDALFALGYAVAEDRLIQMHYIRRLAAGRLSEIAGPEMLESDKLMRLVGMERISRNLVQTLDSETLQLLEAYAAGVNCYMENLRRPLEARLAGFELELWKPADSLLLMRLLGWGLGGNDLADLVARRMRSIIGDRWVDAIFGGSIPDQPPIAREFGRSGTTTPQTANLLALFPSHGASNTWAVSSERSITGAPLLANDPHLELTNPAVWVEATIETPQQTVSGVTIPGFPGITIGRSDHLAWGITAGMIAQKYFYHEEFVNGEQWVRSDDGPVAIQYRDEVILVKGAAPEILRVRSTPRGPLISDLYPELSDEPVSMHWTGAEVSNEFKLFFAVNTASSVSDLIEMRDAVDYAIPTINTSLADDEGNIAMLSFGRYPIRRQHFGTLPISEFPPEYIAPAELPYELNPDRGWIACANNTVVDTDYPYPICGHWDPGFRYQRITQELESRDKHSVAEMRKLQLDQYSIRASVQVPHLLDLIQDNASDWAVNDLLDWDFQMTAGSRAALLFHVFDRFWTNSVFSAHIPDWLVDRLEDIAYAGSIGGLFADRVLQGAIPDWMPDDVRFQTANQAFSDAIGWIADRLGDDPASWTWGDLHQLIFVHPLGTVGGPQRRLVNPGPFAVGGDTTTVCPFPWRTATPFNVYAGPSMRFVTDMRSPDQSWMTNTLGQSGYPLSRHFSDQVQDYLVGRMHRIWPEQNGKKPTVRLEPSRGEPESSGLSSSR